MTFEETRGKFDEAWPKFWKVKDFEKFADIPLDLRVTEALFVWVYDTPENLRLIPVEFVDDDIRLAGVHNNGRVIEYIGKEDTDRYEEIASCALRCNPDSLEKIDPSIFSDHFFVGAIKARSDVVFHLRKVLDSGYKLSSEIVGAAVEHSICAISSLIGAEGFDEMVTDDMVSRGVHSSFVDQYAWWIDLGSLEILGKTSVVQEAISSGFWPITFRVDADEPYFPDVARPASVVEAISAYLLASNVNIAQLFKFAVLSYDPDEVISSLHSTQDGLDILQNLYSQQALAPYAKKYKNLKGRLLEDALGM